MVYSDHFIMMGMGGLFVVIGIALVVRGKSGEKSYDNPSVGMDVTEYLEPEAQPAFESLKVGGWIAIAVGLFMLAMSGAFWLWG